VAISAYSETTLVSDQSPCSLDQVSRVVQNLLIGFHAFVLSGCSGEAWVRVKVSALSRVISSNNSHTAPASRVSRPKKHPAAYCGSDAMRAISSMRPSQSGRSGDSNRAVILHRQSAADNLPTLLLSCGASCRHRQNCSAIQTWCGASRWRSQIRGKARCHSRSIKTSH
jgi:hypothetical protein